MLLNKIFYTSFIRVDEILLIRIFGNRNDHPARHCFYHGSSHTWEARSAQTGTAESIFPGSTTDDRATCMITRVPTGNYFAQFLPMNGISYNLSAMNGLDL